MRKVLSIISITAGILVFLSVVAPMVMGAILEAQISNSVGIISGMDGPTAIMLVGAIGGRNVIYESVIGVLLVVVGIWGLRKMKR